MLSDKTSGEFEKTYNLYSEAIFRHCFFRLRNNRELALDITQETFLKTWNYLSRGNQIDNIRAFLYRTATNLIIDNSRKKRLYSLEELQENGSGIRLDNVSNDNISAKAEVKLAMQKINKLKPQYKDAIIMRYIDELPVKEIAQILGQSENSVSVNIHRGLAQLKKMIT